MKNKIENGENLLRQIKIKNNLNLGRQRIIRDLIFFLDWRLEVLLI